MCILQIGGTVTLLSDSEIRIKLSEIESSRWVAIDTLLQALQSAGPGVWQPMKKLEGEPSNVFSMPSFAQSAELSALVTALYDSGLIMGFGWPEWLESLSQPPNPQGENGNDPVFLVKYVTATVRQDRFVEGFLNSECENGNFLHAVQRLIHLSKSYNESTLRSSPPNNLLTTAFYDDIFFAIQSLGKATGSSLAHLCLTSKPESALRDRIAWALQNAHPGGVVAREWTPTTRLEDFESPRFDLTVFGDLEGGPPTHQPQYAIELKVYGFLEQADALPDHHREAMARDLLKLRQLRKSQNDAGNHEFVSYFVLIHQTLRNQVPKELDGIVKYASRSNRAHQKYPDRLDEIRDVANSNAADWLRSHGMLLPGSGWLKLDVGSHWGIGVNLDFLVCQVL